MIPASKSHWTFKLTHKGFCCKGDACLAQVKGLYLWLWGGQSSLGSMDLTLQYFILPTHFLPKCWRWQTVENDSLVALRTLSRPCCSVVLLHTLNCYCLAKTCHWISIMLLVCLNGEVCMCGGDRGWNSTLTNVECSTCTSTFSLLDGTIVPPLCVLFWGFSQPSPEPILQGANGGEEGSSIVQEFVMWIMHTETSGFCIGGM